ncbi:MAG TPA: PLP-dependent aminotransferase family protein [Gaiellaceae bacterium]|nr:PLP-dependent aminotransferase family protein [Gaiellaceae bacterium]
MISLARGWPTPECLPVEELADCARVALERDGKTILSYGSSLGYGPLREWIAARHGVEPGRIMLTNGSLQGLVLLSQHLAPGKRVLVERPTYDRPLKILRAVGAEIVPLDTDDDGLDPDALERELANGPAPAFMYLLPTFQNPSGRTLTLERRQRVAELAREHDLLVLEDDPYGLIRFEGEHLPLLLDISEGFTAYSSSFSKTISPGLRVGWFVLPEKLARELEAIATGTYITPVQLGEATIHEFISRGNFEPNVARVRELLRVRRNAMLDALERELPNQRWTHPDGGYFLWLEVEGVDATALLARAEQAGVTYVKGADFGGEPDTIRLAYSFVSPEEIGDGIARLASAIPVAA